MYKGAEYHVQDYVYVSPYWFTEERIEAATFKSERNVGLRTYVVRQILEIMFHMESKKMKAKYIQMKVRRFYRLKDNSTEKEYASDIQKVSILIHY